MISFIINKIHLICLNYAVKYEIGQIYKNRRSKKKLTYIWYPNISDESPDTPLIHQLLELFISALEHKTQRQIDPTFHDLKVPRLDPFLQTKSKELRELLQLLQVPFHLLTKILKLWLEVILNTVSEQCWTPPHHTLGLST